MDVLSVSGMDIIKAHLTHLLEHSFVLIVLCVHMKGKINAKEHTNVVYKITCKGCSQYYVGEIWAQE